MLVALHTKVSSQPETRFPRCTKPIYPHPFSPGLGLTQPLNSEKGLLIGFCKIRVGKEDYIKIPHMGASREARGLKLSFASVLYCTLGLIQPFNTVHPSFYRTISSQ